MQVFKMCKDINIILFLSLVCMLKKLQEPLYKSLAKILI
jgi:hypothetical protein